MRKGKKKGGIKQLLMVFDCKMNANAYKIRIRIKKILTVFEN